MAYTSFCSPKIVNGRFVTPWTVHNRPNLLRFLWTVYQEGSGQCLPSAKELDGIPEMKVLELSQEKLANPSSVQVTWLGHASALVQVEGLNILTDPIFAEYAGPVRFMSPKRYRKCPCSVDDLPPIHAVLISHDHYDHLCITTVRNLHRKFGRLITWFVPAGTKSWMDSTIHDANVIELNWWEEHKQELSFASGRSEFTFAAVPAQHYCIRAGLDENKRLWCGWVVKGISKSIYFAGDTGYCDAFKDVGIRYGPIDIGLIPIGCYQPRRVMSYQHCDPEEAVKIHLDVKAKNSVGIHWGTFNMNSTEHFLEPPRLLAEHAHKYGVDTFITLRHGETRSFDGEDYESGSMKL